jgi:hypothetical protein
VLDIVHILCQTTVAGQTLAEKLVLRTPEECKRVSEKLYEYTGGVGRTIRSFVSYCINQGLQAAESIIATIDGITTSRLTEHEWTPPSMSMAMSRLGISDTSDTAALHDCARVVFHMALAKVPFPISTTLVFESIPSQRLVDVAYAFGCPYDIADVQLTEASDCEMSAKDQSSQVYIVAGIWTLSVLEGIVQETWYDLQRKEHAVAAQVPISSLAVAQLARASSPQARGWVFEHLCAERLWMLARLRGFVRLASVWRDILPHFSGTAVGDDPYVITSVSRVGNVSKAGKGSMHLAKQLQELVAGSVVFPGGATSASQDLFVRTRSAVIGIQCKCVRNTNEVGISVIDEELKKIPKDLSCAYVLVIYSLHIDQTLRDNIPERVGYVTFGPGRWVKGSNTSHKVKDGSSGTLPTVFCVPERVQVVVVCPNHRNGLSAVFGEKEVTAMQSVVNSNPNALAIMCVRAIAPDIAVQT